jgi:glycosyltransferase involved in cell wall biosynthesis
LKIKSILDNKLNISVIIPVYNAAPFVEEAVLSALYQEETGEVILIEDGSTDNSLEICESLEKQFNIVKLFTHPNHKNMGEGESRNLGIKNASFDYITFLDSDDFFLPDRFKKTEEIFNLKLDIDGVYEAVGNFYENEDVKNQLKLNNFKAPPIITFSKKIKPSSLFENILYGFWGRFAVGGLTVKKQIFERCGFFDSRLRISPDTHMWLKMTSVGKFVAGNLISPVTMRRFHGNNTITKLSIKEKYKIKKRIFSFLHEWACITKIRKKHLAMIKYEIFYLNEYLNEKSEVFKSNIGTLNSFFSFIKKSPLYGIIALYVHVKIYFKLYYNNLKIK